MADTNLFDDPAPTPVEVVNVVPTPTLPDPLKELVGEGKKYASVEKALESIPHAQAHIARLEQEAKELREAVAKAKGVDEVYETVQELLKSEKATPAPTVVDEGTLASLLDRKLAEREAAAQAAANREAFRKALVDKYGDKAKEVFSAKARELGIGEDFLGSVVSKSASAALGLFGMTATTPKSVASTGSINTAALNNTTTEQKHKPVMYGASTQEILAAWRAAAPKTN